MKKGFIAGSLKNNIGRMKGRIGLLKRLGFKPSYMLLPLALSLGVTFMEAVTVTALIPFVKGIISRDFQFVRETAVFGRLINFIPHWLVLSNTNIFIILLSVVFLSGIFKNALMYLSQISVAYQVRRFCASLREMIFERYIRFGKMFFDRNSISSLQNVLTNFSYQIGQAFAGVNSALNQMFLLFLYLAMMFVISWKITAFVLLALPLFDLLFRGLMKKLAASSHNNAETSNILSRRLYNILSGITLVKLYNNEEIEKRNFSESNARLKDAEFSVDKKVSLITPLQEAVFLVVILFIIALMSYVYVGEKTGGLAYFMVYFYLLRRAQQAIGSFNSLKAAYASVKGPISSVSAMLSDDGKFFIPEGKKNFEGLKERIEFRHLNFSYQQNRQVIHDLSFCVEKGQMAAFVGATGAGKTTLVNLLLRFYDCPAGSILIDGMDIRSFTFKSLLGHFAYVSQETVLFNDTLRNNIVYGLKMNPGEAAVVEVLKKARLFDFVSSLPEGLDTLIGDHGVRLSGGEKQRVAIARAMLKGAEILIFDEATSSLDSKTERLIQESIGEAVKDRTVIVIAHRLSTIKNADKIVVIEKGRLAEEGSLEGLLDKKGKFYEYWQEQKFF